MTYYILSDEDGDRYGTIEGGEGFEDRVKEALSNCDCTVKDGETIEENSSFEGFNNWETPKEFYLEATCIYHAKERPLTVVIEGGLVQSVVTDDPFKIGQTVNIVDYDTEGADENELSSVVQDDGKTVEAFVRQDVIEPAGIKVNL